MICISKPWMRIRLLVPRKRTLKLVSLFTFWEGGEGNIVSWGAGRKWADTKAGGRRGRGAEVGNHEGEWIIFR